MSTSVSVMRHVNTMRRLLREHFFRTNTSRYVRSNVSFILLCIYQLFGREEISGLLVLWLTGSSMKYLFFQLRFCCN